MSFVSRTFSKVGDILSGGAGDAAEKAAGIQAAAGDRAIASQERTAAQARADLQPFAEAGKAQLDPLSSLISDPNAQRNFILDNPFFKTLADDAQRRLFNNQAAIGKVGSGGTAEALQNSLVLLGQDLVNQNVNQRFNLASLGANAAAGQGTATQQTGSNIANLITGTGNVLAAGQVGAANARAQGINNLIQGGTAAVALSDERAKTDILLIGHADNGLPIYLFRYIGSDEFRIGVMAQDVEKTDPNAVVEINDLKYLNLEAVTWH